MFKKNYSSFLLTILFSLIAFTNVEGKIMRYVDENGVVTYTDDEEEAEKYSYDEYDDLGAPNPDKVQFKFDAETGQLYVVNEFASEITVKVHVSDKTVILSDIIFDIPIEIPGSSEILLGTITQIAEGEVELTNSFEIGKIYKGSENYYYLTNPNELCVPFIGKFAVTQGWEGGFTHKGPKSRYAIDVSMPIGTPIIAVKGGRVIDMKMDSSLGGKNKKYRAHANFIKIQHNDGTMSVYVHLKGHSQTVQIGDFVKKGQIIALSGNTGYTTGPHLHFAIQTNTQQGVRSIKFRFDGVEPLSGTYLSN